MVAHENEELTGTKHFGFSLRDKAPISGFENIRVKAVTTWSEKQTVIFFMLKGIFYLIYYHLFGLPSD